MRLTINIDLDRTRGALAETSHMVVADALRALAEDVEDGMEFDGAGNVESPEFGDTIGFWEVTA